MNKIIERLKDWERKGRGYPIQAQIHPTNFCNLKCIFCPTRALVKELDRKKELKREEWLRVIEEGKKLGIEEWHICGGGEPLFFTNDCLAMMKSIKEFDGYGEMITNGTFFKEDVAKEIVGMGWNKIFISLDSPNERTQNFLRGSNCFREIVKGIKNINEWKRKLKANEPHLYFHMVVCNKNYQQVSGLVRLAHKLRVEGISLNALNIWKEEVARLKLSEKDEKKLEKILKGSKELANRLNISTNIDDFLKFLFFERANIMNKAMVEVVEKKEASFASLACYYPWYNISIFSDGRALPCFILKDEGENVREKSLKEIWFGNYFNEIRQTFLKNRLKEDCSKCNPWNLPKMKEIREKLKEVLVKNPNS